MKLDRLELLKRISLKQEVFEVPSWGNAEAKVRELSISETKEYYQMVKDKKPIEDIIKYACKCTMIEPTMFTDEELETMSQDGISGLNEIFANIQVIGKTKEQKEEFFKNVNDTSKASKETETLTKEEEEKK